MSDQLLIKIYYLTKKNLSNQIKVFQLTQQLHYIVTVTIAKGNIINQIDVYHGSGDKWVKETFNSESGKYTGKSVQYDLTGLLNLESGIKKDLNKDGYVGDKITKIITSNLMTGNNEFKAGLFESASGGYYFDDSGTMSPGSAIHNNSRLLKANSN